MSVRVTRFSAVGPRDAGYGSLVDDSTREQRETTVDGYTFHWGRNEKRSFLDDGVGLAHGAFAPGANIVADTIPFGTSRS